MRIAIVTVSKGVHTRVYVEYLVEAGHDVTVITNRAGYEVDGVSTVNTRPLERRRLLMSDRVLLGLRDRAIRAALQRGRFDVVNVQMLTSDGIVAALAAEAPLVISLYGSDVYRRDALARRYLEAVPSALRRATLLHSVSNHMTAELVGLGVDPARIETFQYGVDTDLFAPSPVRDVERIVSTRALRPLYRVHLIVEAMPAVLEERPGARLVVYDSGSEEARLRQTVDRLGLTRAVQFVGRQPAEQIASDLGASGVWVSMAESDGTPISMLEAMSSGAVPVVADLETLHEWLDPTRAVFVEATAQGVAGGLLAGLDLAGRDDVIGRNREVVTERAERSVNLARFEGLLRRAAGSS
jgi:glycosyltransferase involved in cell wall biosynthesis